MKCLWLIMILIYAPLLGDAQNKPSLAAKIERVIRQKELGWKRNNNAPAVRTIPRKTKILAEKSWYRAPKGGGWENVSANVYQFESSSAASNWLELREERKKFPGWEIEKYELGNEAYFSKNRGSNTYILQIRHSNIVIEVAGNSLETVKRFAQYVFTLVAAI